MSNRITETVQTAAVAVAMLEDARSSEGAVGGLYTEEALEALRNERLRQNEKWGAQHHAPITWLMILMEEVGELAEDTPVPDEVGNQAGSVASIRMNIIHAGQEAKRWLERQ